MFKQVILAAFAICLLIGLSNAMSININMMSGTTTFTDSMSFSGASFSQNTAVDFSKTGIISDDPHFGACHGFTNYNGDISGQAVYQMSNNGIQAQSLFDSGSATATMQFKEDGLSVALLQGLQTGNDVYNAWTSSRFTNYEDMTSAFNNNWQYQNAQTINSMSFNRGTGTLSITDYIASPIITGLDRPTFV